MSDGTRFYVSTATGEIVARRTRFWRIYDWMWGLHIMDLKTREDPHNAWVLGFGLVALLTTAMALLLLPLASVRSSGLNVRLQTISVWARQAWRRICPPPTHTRISPRLLAVAQ